MVKIYEARFACWAVTYTHHKHISSAVQVSPSFPFLVLSTVSSAPAGLVISAEVTLRPLRKEMFYR
jgi:hypothetical protein